MFVILFIGFFLLVFFSSLILSKKLPQIKGHFGESQVQKVLFELDTEKYIILNDLFLRLSSGRTSQIDHVIVSVFGIFVIETKNYTGWIFGSEKSDNWTQVIYKNKTSFRNPIKQNQSHIFALKEILNDFSYVNYIPIVVFSNKATFKNLNVNSIVINKLELLETIYNQSYKEELPKETIQRIVTKLIDKNIGDKEIRKNHIETIKNRIAEQTIKEVNLICPRCNSPLIKREGKYGTFFGCTNYPYCKFTKK